MLSAHCTLSHHPRESLWWIWYGQIHVSPGKTTQNSALPHRAVLQNRQEHCPPCCGHPLPPSATANSHTGGTALPAASKARFPRHGELLAPFSSPWHKIQPQAHPVSASHATALHPPLDHLFNYIPGVEIRDAIKSWVLFILIFPPSVSPRLHFRAPTLLGQDSI